MNLRQIVRAIRAHLTLANLANLPTLPVLGNILDGPGAAAYLAAAAAQSAPNQLPLAYSPVTNASTTALTLSAANAIEGIVNAVVVPSGGSANTNTTDTATNILNLFWPNAYVGATAKSHFVNLNSGTMTLAGGVGVTISGTATIVTLAECVFRIKCTNLATPNGVLGSQTLKPGAASTNSTTTTAAVTNNAGVANPTSIINVASATGIATAAGASWLGVVNTDGTTSYYQVSAVNTLAITVLGNINKNVASGAAVTVYNNTFTITRLYSCVTAIMAA